VSHVSTLASGGQELVLRHGKTVQTPRLACNRTEAAHALGVSVDFFDEHVADELPCVRRGRLRLYPVAELERWLERAAERIGRGGLAVFSPFAAHRSAHLAHVAVVVLLWIVPWR